MDVLVPSRFRFREASHDDSSSNNATNSSDTLSSYDDQNDELQSMAGKGIMHLCSELMELKRVSNEEFHQDLFSNYSAFVSIFQEVEGIKTEIIQLKKYVSNQNRLIKGLSDGIDLNVLLKVSYEYIVEDHINLITSPQSLFMVHTEKVCDVLDVLLSEKRIDEALEVLESEDMILEDMQSQKNLPMNEFTYYNSVLSEKRDKIVEYLKLIAESSRVSSAELLKDLSRLCRVGDRHLATHLLLRHYQSRITSGIQKLQFVKYANGTYIHNAAKFTFSMISQATKSFFILNGEQSSYYPDLVQWAYGETEIFSACFTKYVKSISDINGGMVTVLEALQSALSYCSLLEAETLMLNTCLVKHIRPCLQEFLKNHIDHFKKVIGIFTSADAWVVDRYLLSGVLGEDCSSLVDEELPEYCWLSSSGWKLVMVLQAITAYVVPLLEIQLEGHILRGLIELFTEYISLLECALSSKLNTLEKMDKEINLAETPDQQVSFLANISSLALLLSNIIRGAFNSITSLTFEADNIIVFINESPDQLRAQLCQKFISNILDGSGCRLIFEAWAGGESGSYRLDDYHDMMPSLVFQGLFFELKKLENFSEDNLLEVDLLLDFMRELTVAVFISILNNEELWRNISEEFSVNHASNLKQCLLDLQFLVEIAKHGGYFCDDIMGASSSVLSRMEATFISAGLVRESAAINEEWAQKAAKEGLQNLQETTETESPPNETIEGNLEGSDSVCASDMSSESDGISPKEILVLGSNSLGDNTSVIKSGDSISSPGDIGDEIAFETTNTAEEIKHMKSPLEPLSPGDDVETYEAWSKEDETRSQDNVSELVLIEVEEDDITESAETSFQVSTNKSTCIELEKLELNVWPKS